MPRSVNDVAMTVGVPRSVRRNAVSQGRRGVSIGEALAEARCQAGLTVTQVSDQTRIRETIITAIEGNDYSACGSDPFVREYIRSIAQAVGTDPEPLIWEYDTAQHGPQATPDNAVEPVTFTKRGEWLWRTWFAVVALVVAALWFAAFEFLAGPRDALPPRPRPGHTQLLTGTPAIAGKRRRRRVRPPRGPSRRAC